MKIIRYFLEVNEKGEGEVFGIISADGTKKMLGNIGNVIGMESDNIKDLVDVVLKQNEVEIVTLKQLILEEQGVDLQFVRTKMRKVARDLTNDSKSIQERKDLAEVYSDACVACKVIVDACKYEATLLALKEKYDDEE